MHLGGRLRGPPGRPSVHYVGLLPHYEFGMSFTLDHILGDSIELDRCPNELSALRTLESGLSMIYATVRPHEEAHQARAPGWTSFGNLTHEGVPPHILAALPVFFSWFAVTGANYVRLVGYLRAIAKGVLTESDLGTTAGSKTILAECDAYRDSIAELADMHRWRNKVAAHFALTAPRKEDNAATLVDSALPVVGVERGRFHTRPFRFGKIDGGATIDSELPNWSLTEAYEHMAARYGPRAGDPGSQPPRAADPSTT